jgi:Zn-dependent protease
MQFTFIKIIHWLFPFFEGVVYGVAAMILHECGHVVAAVWAGIRVSSVGIRWKGMYTVRESGPPGKNIIISLAGPGTNLVLAVVWSWLPVFALANLCMGLCNLLPIKGSDGERALECWRMMRQQKAGGESDSNAG